MRETEANLLAYVQLTNREVLSTGDLCKPLGLTPKQERELLSRLARSGLLVRLKRGTYLAPLKMPPGRRFAPGPELVLRRLMEAMEATYQVGGPNAFHAHGFDDQVPNLTYVYNSSVSGPRSIGGNEFIFIKVALSRMGGVVETGRTATSGMPITDVPRTLTDAIYDWSRFNTLPRAYGWIATAYRRDSSLPGRLVDCACRYGNVATCRRLGFLLERLGVPVSMLQPLRQAVGAGKSIIPWIPGREGRGPVSSWGVIANGGIPDA
jgi:predicted transcriptional regulator of viral defense system